MIVSEGTNELERYRKKVVTYKFFENHPQIKIFGIEEQLEALVSHFKGAAGGFGPEKRILLLCGPVGSSKSTILRLIKRGLEAYSRIDDGALYTFKWVNLPAGAEGIYTSDNCCCPMNEEPLKLIPIETVRKFSQILIKFFVIRLQIKKNLQSIICMLMESLIQSASSFMKNCLNNTRAIGAK